MGIWYETENTFQFGQIHKSLWNWKIPWAYHEKHVDWKYTAFREQINWKSCGYCMRKVQEPEGHIHRSYKTIVLDMLESNDQADRPEGKATMTKACIHHKSEQLKSWGQKKAKVSVSEPLSGRQTFEPFPNRRWDKMEHKLIMGFLECLGT